MNKPGKLHIEHLHMFSFLMVSSKAKPKEEFLSEKDRLELSDSQERF